MHINRKELINEIQEERKLRALVRKGIKILLEKKKVEASRYDADEKRLRGIIRNLIKEAQSTDVPAEIPHQNTGINVLETLLKKIVPIIEDDYKSLTSNEGQRVSFRAHVLSAVKNSLAPIDAVRGVPKEAPGALEEQDVDITVKDTDKKFIPVRQQDIEPEEDKESDEEKFGIPGEDLTGRNFAFQSYNKVENQIMDAYQSLASSEDKELFYDYLLTNLKLYFDKFEDELAANLEEPTTPEYEEEKAAAVEEPAGEEPAGEELGL